jgi:hypothetical protein
MKANAHTPLTAGCGWDRDVNRLTPHVQQFPKAGGTSMADDGTPSAGENRRHQPGLFGGAPMPDGVYALK